jgi:hypothetical protein
MEKISRQEYLNIVESNLPAGTKISNTITGDMFFSQLLYSSELKKSFLKKLEFCIENKYHDVFQNIIRDIQSGNKDFIIDNKYNNQFFSFHANDHINRIKHSFHTVVDEGESYERMIFNVFSKWRISKQSYSFNKELFLEVIQSDVNREDMKEMLGIIHDDIYHPVFVDIPECHRHLFNLPAYKKKKLRPIGFFIDSGDGLTDKENDLFFIMFFEKTKIDKKNPVFGAYSPVIINSKNANDVLDYSGEDFEHIFKKMLLLSLYLYSSNNSKNQPNNKPIKHSDKKDDKIFIFAKSQNRNVIDYTENKTSKKQNSIKNHTKRPHTRKPHFSTYWVIDPDNQKEKIKRIKWIPTIFVNF